jgi:hypothetical protein
MKTRAEFASCEIALKRAAVSSLVVRPFEDAVGEIDQNGLAVEPRKFLI